MLEALYAGYVPVRVTDMRGVDLARWPFDFDLTFAMLAVHPDGTVYHRYGGRDWRGADRWLTRASLEAFLRAGLARHDKRGTGLADDTPRGIKAYP